jgi:hypothetical protein
LHIAQRHLLEIKTAEPILALPDGATSRENKTHLKLLIRKKTSEK